ncbi:MAG: efflux RND transporter periplasmic adaptor subunit [Planctomycetota bacterium]|nr:efflux RND transporter periplasmic adaptor subunit [Planctomycetota bacterium]
MNRKTFTAASVTVVITVLAILVIHNMVSSGPGDRAVAQGPGDNAAVGKAVNVEVTTPEQRPLTRSLRMPATLLAGKMADLYAKTSGYITEVKVDIGDHVSAGDPLLVIDVPEMGDELRQAQAVLEARRAKVKQAEAMITIARAEVQRYKAQLDLKSITMERKKMLRVGNAIPQQELDEAESEREIAVAQMKIAEARVAGGDADAKVAESEVAMAAATVARLETLMKYATLRAPFDGVITARMVDPGAFVRSAAEGNTTPLLSIAHIDFIRLALEIPESDALFVKPGTDVEIKIKALGVEPIQAKITRAARALKENTRTMRAEVRLENPSGRLAPGMYAQVEIRLETKKQAMVIPARALRVRDRDISVLIVNGDVAESVAIEIGYDDGIVVEVTAGLSGDERIIISSNGAVVPGAAVRTVVLKSAAS